MSKCTTSLRPRVSALLLTVTAAVHPAAEAVAEPRPASPRTTPTAQSVERPSSEASLDQRLAGDWGLSPEDWTRYRQLMQGPLGTYSPNLDPLTALGIEARNDEERRRMADLQVKAEARRTEKLLSYQRAYDEAWRRAFPNAVRVNLPGAQAPAPTGNGRLALFVKDGCAPCDAQARTLQAANTPFDLYMVGSRQDDARIRQWAARVGIDPEKVRARTITLNHDTGRWLSLGVGGELPAVLHETPSGWQRQ
ncbi:TIGR03759 family integrating conjugative element protein [Burkholderia sola]|uniref:TIGR03759 family integrating conjugative element protein n=1 Tax=Burkholderia TaxID=32008 RepID=UPI001AE1638B|nr:TIGR03759 family integrating conjugative element protein [Burkholderia sp. AcTa6-5]MBP0714262.1 TIGR03759 family integrating conjugative element protein [Burkholderia sp. AcTa6-5]